MTQPACFLLSSAAAPGISASPSEDNLRYFNVMILGPTTSPYEGEIHAEQVLFNVSVCCYCVDMRGLLFM